MMAADVYRPDQWHNFFLVVGTGAAALTGLAVVAMSLHVEVIVRDWVLRHRAMNTLAGLAAAFMASALVLMGGQDHRAVGLELLIVSVVVAGGAIRSFTQVVKSGTSVPRSTLNRTVGSQICWLAQIVGGAILIAGSVSGLYVAAVAIVVNFYFMISGSWLLLVGVSTDETQQQRPDG